MVVSVAARGSEAFDQFVPSARMASSWNAAGGDACRGQRDREDANGSAGEDWADPGRPMTAKRISRPASATAAVRPTATPRQVDTTVCRETSQ